MPLPAWLDWVRPRPRTSPLAEALTTRLHGRGSLVASAALLNPQEGLRLAKASKRREWQRASFGYARALPEVGYAMRFLANNAAHIRLYAGDRPPGVDEVAELTDEYGWIEGTGDEADVYDLDALPADLVLAARAAVDELTGYSPSGGGAAILSPITRNYETAGECYLVGRYFPEGNNGAGREEWAVRSVSELTAQEGRFRGMDPALPPGYWRLTTGEGRDSEAVDLDPSTTTVYRLWTADAEWSSEPDSPMRSLIGVCERLLLIERGDDAALRSRAAGNGLLLWPEELDSIPDEDEEEDEFDRDFVTQLTTPLTLDGSAAQVVPMIKRGAAAYLDKVRHLTFGRPLDPLTSEREARLLTRLGIGLDVPPEVITGLSDVNHWNAWQISSDTFRHHQEPITIAAVEGLTLAYMRSRLRSANTWPDELVRRVVVWFDPSSLVAPADMSSAANDAHDRGLITDDGYRQLRGIDESFAPADEVDTGSDPVGETGLAVERLLAVANIAKVLLDAGYTPDSVNEALGLAIEHTGTVPATAGPAALPAGDQPGDEATTPEAPPPPASGAPLAITAAGPTDKQRRLARRLATIERTLRERIVAAADAAVLRALERAGNRARAAAQREPAARDAVSGQPPENVLASLGRPLVAALGLEEQQLLAEAFGRLREQYAEWTATAAEEALDAAVGIAGLDRTDPAVAQQIGVLRDRFADNVDASWPTLETGLRDLAADRMYSPDPTVDPLGELPSSIVPPGLIRDALAVAGGVPGDASGTGPRNGLTSGELLDGFLRAHGQEVAEYEWAYGISARPFRPHADLDGVIFAGFDDPVLDAPPEASWIGNTLAPGDHTGCFVGDVIVSGPRARASFTRWYDGPGIEVVTQSGKRFTATPNHPIQTLTGWRAAGDLAEGEYLVVQAGPQGALPVDEDVQQVPAPISEVAAALPVMDEATGGQVPTAAEDFHGDGVGSDGQITVVRADRRLMFDGQTPLGQVVPDEELDGARQTEGPLPAQRHAMRLVVGPLPSPRGVVRGSSERGALLGSAVGVAEPLRLGESAQRDAEALELVEDGPPVVPVAIREALGALAGEVTADEVVVVRPVPLRTHVYNLSTDTGWYFANGIVAHNCHCDYVPIYRDARDTRAELEQIGERSYIEQNGRPIPTRQATVDERVYVDPTGRPEQRPSRAAEAARVLRNGPPVVLPPTEPVPPRRQTARGRTRQAPTDEAGVPMRLDHTYLSALTEEQLDDLAVHVAARMDSLDPREGQRWDDLDAFLTYGDEERRVADDLAARMASDDEWQAAYRQLDERLARPGVTHPRVGGHGDRTATPTRADVQEDYALHLEQQYVAMEAHVGTHGVNAAGRARGIDARDLLSGDIRLVYRYASPELLEFLETNRRISWTEFYFARTGRGNPLVAARQAEENARINQDRTNRQRGRRK